MFEHTVFNHTVYGHTVFGRTVFGRTVFGDTPRLDLLIPLMSTEGEMRSPRARRIRRFSGAFAIPA